MKKLLLSMMGAVALCASASAADVPLLQERSNEFQTLEYPIELRKSKPVAVKSSAEGTETFNYCMHGEAYTALGFNSAAARNKVAMAFEMTPEITTEYAGKVITHINFYTGVDASTSKTNNIKSVTVFLSDGNHTKAFYTQTAEVTSDPFTYYSVKLDQPYTIEAGKDLFIGAYSILTKSKDYALVIDDIPEHTDPAGGWASSSTTVASNFQWQNLAEAGYGYVCVSAILEGENFPQNKVGFYNLNAPMYSEANKEFAVETVFVNKGTNNVESIELEYTIGDSRPQTTVITPAAPVEPLQTTAATLKMSLPSVGAFNTVVKVTKVNGVDVTDMDLKEEFTTVVLANNMGFTPNVVIEEFTGAWCGYCPVGIVTMEYIRDTFTDGTFIPVAIHSEDAMQSDSYVEINTRYNAFGYPNAIINRDPTYENNAGSLYPYPASEMVGFYNQIRTGSVPLEVTLTCNFADDNKKAVVFEGNTKYCLDYTKLPYNISFGITEDNVGPYTQTNYYSGETGDYGGWEKEAYSVRTIYNDVARKYDGIDGVEGLLPAAISADTEYPYSYTMTLPANVKPDNLNGVVYITDKRSGRIVNAAMVKAGNFGIAAGVNDIFSDADANAPVEYFNLQGMKVESPANGIFIRRQGAKAEKVAIN